MPCQRSSLLSHDPQPSVEGYRYATQGDVTPVTPIATFVARKVRPNTDLTFPYLRAVQRPASTSVCGGKWLRPSTLFVNTTGGFYVMAFELCQEGNREPSA